MGASNTDLLTTIEVSELLGLTPDGVRFLARTGRLAAAQTVGRGQRLFRRRDVELLARERAKQAAAGRDDKGIPPGLAPSQVHPDSEAEIFRAHSEAWAPTAPLTEEET
jgi:excisionase family DNA binding protein